MDKNELINLLITANEDASFVINCNEKRYADFLKKYECYVKEYKK